MNHARTILARDSNDETNYLMTDTPTTRYDAPFEYSAAIAHGEPVLTEAKSASGREVLDR